MSLFDQYLKTRTETNKKVAESTNTKGQKDDRFWKPTFNKETGTGFAVVRFLPGIDPAELPYAKVFNHFVEGKTGELYWEKSLTTIGQKDPMSELNGRLWATKDVKMQNIARDQKRKPQNITNVLVITDPEHPENEGQVFLYKANQVVFNKIEEARKTVDEYGEPQDSIEAFDIIDGAPFKIKIKLKGDWQNYDDCEFGKVCPLSEKKKEMKEIFESQYDLKEFTDPENFKSYDELLAHMNDVLSSEVWANEFLVRPASTHQAVGEIIDSSEFEETATETATSEPADEDDEDLSDFLSSLD